MVDWEDIGYKEPTAYEKYTKKPPWWWDQFVGPPRPWGGKRKGAGRPSTKKQQTPKDGLTVVLKMNNIQRLNLEELGDGDLAIGIERLIEKYL